METQKANRLFFLHGGPGSGSSSGQRRFFDPNAFRIVLFDQRGCGRSLPLADEPDADLTSNTTSHLIGDVDAYATLLFHSDPDVREWAASEWCAWEDAHVSLTPGHRPNPRFQDSGFRLRFSRLVTHYWRNAAFLEDDQLLRDASLLDGIPGVLIHGRYDVSSPLETAWRLSRQWTTSRLQVLEDAGHGGGDTLPAAIGNALTQFASD